MDDKAEKEKGDEQLYLKEGYVGILNQHLSEEDMKLLDEGTQIIFRKYRKAIHNLAKR